MKNEVIIIGGGVSGLATAFYLKRAGIQCTLLEKSTRLGGLIHTDHLCGCDLEAGPDSFISNKPAGVKLAQDLEIADQLIGTNDELRRVFVLKDGRLSAMPKSMVMMVPGKWWPALRSPLFSFGTKARLLFETRFQPRQRNGDFSVREFVTDHFGSQALEYVTEPLLAGVYGGNSADLSARSVLPKFVDYERRFGSLITGVKRQAHAQKPASSLFLSFRGGMGTLIDALQERIKDSVGIIHRQASQVIRTGDNWEVFTDGEVLKASHVVLTSPAGTSANLLSSAAPKLSSMLAQIPYSSATLVTLLYRKASFGHPLNGFGFLVPKSERNLIAAATWINTKFPSRVNRDYVAIRVFIVDPESRKHRGTSARTLIELAHADLARMMKISSNPIHSLVYDWPDSMPQYVVGHEARRQTLLSSLNAFPGLHLSSNYLDGVGIPDCIRHAESTARAIVRDLHSTE